MSNTPPSQWMANLGTQLGVGPVREPVPPMLGGPVPQNWNAPPPPPPGGAAPPPPPPPPPPGGVAVAPPPPPQPAPYAQTSLASGGGYSPAHEASIRGPKATGLGLAAYDAQAHGVEAARQVNEAQVANDVNMFEQQMADAQARKAQYDAVLAKRSNELTDLRHKYEEGAGLLSQAAINEDRFWASESTPKKIAWGLGMVLGGIASGITGKSNSVLDVYQDKVNKDIEAQKFLYKAGSEAVGARQTLYSMAMSQYQNEDAADAMVRAAANDRAIAEIRKSEAQWKGTAQEAHALEAIAKLQADSLQYQAQGLQFVQARASEPRFNVTIAGQTFMGVTNKERNELIGKYGVAHQQDMEGRVVQSGLDIQKATATEAAKAEGKGSDEAKHISDQILKAEIPQGRALSNAVLTSLSTTPIEGIEKVPGLRALPDRWMGDDVDAREQAWADFVAVASKNKFGAVTTADEKKAAAIFERGFKNPAARIGAVRLYQSNLDQQERTILGGASPAGQRAYRENAAAAGLMPGASVGRKVETFGGK